MSNTQAVEQVKKNGKRKLIPVVIVLAIVVVILVYWFINRGWVSTDDAQIQGNLVPISSRVSGYVDKIAVKENQPVSAGELLVQLDARDLETKLKSAEANLALQMAQSSAASTSVTMVERTSVAGQQQADAGVAAAESGIGAAEAQAAAAGAGAQAAQDGVAGARSDVETATSAIDAARAGVQAAEANVLSTAAQAQKTANDAKRFQELYANGAIPKEQLEAMDAGNVSAQSAYKAAREQVKSAKAALQQAKSRKASAASGLKQAISRAAAAQATLRQAQSGVKSAQTALSEARARLSGASTAPQQIAISKSQDKAASARLRQALAEVANAKLQLSYAKIAAPVEGIVSQKSAEPGQYVQPGQLLMSIVPLNNVWAVANFKETEIAHLRVGQKAQIYIDTYSGRSLRGRIDSIGAATGAKFSLLPPENATGNFVKVVQRIPVKIVFDEPFPSGVLPRVGMNVVARVKVNGGQSR